MSEEDLGEIKQLLAWYKRIGNVTVESLGLESGTVIIKLEGRRRSFRSLVTLFDPSSDTDFSDWLKDLIASHKRAGVEFDRVEVWVPPERLDESIRESEKFGANIVIRSLSEPSFASGLIISERNYKEREGSTLPKYREGGEKRVTAQFNPNREKSTTNREKSTIVATENNKLNSYNSAEIEKRENINEILNEIKAIIDQSMRTILDEIRRESDTNLVKRIEYLEKRIDVLEAVIKLLGNQGVSINEPFTQRMMEPSYVKRDEVLHGSNDTRISEEEYRVVDETQQSNIPLKEESEPESSTPSPSEDVLEEILSNPWIEILSEKGGDVEG